MIFMENTKLYQYMKKPTMNIHWWKVIMINWRQSVLHDNITGAVLSKSEVYFEKLKATSRKEVYALFEKFKTDGVDLFKLDHLLMQKSKSFYQLENKQSVDGLIDSQKNIKLKIQINYSIIFVLSI